MVALTDVQQHCLGLLTRASACVKCDGHNFRVDAWPQGQGYAVSRVCLICGDRISMKGVNA